MAASSLEDQLSDGNPSFGDNMVVDSTQLWPKVRKTYTIKKQREKWTEQEHQKFVEALKLHGRAWRHIEEHIGTKTAVQIRSHAQKFFSKVVRHSTDATSSAVTIEIPPPRPKRKPAHPYPRKTNIPTVIRTGSGTGRKTVVVVDPKRSVSPTLSVSEQEHQSPTSVLSGPANSTSPSPFSSPNINSSVFESDSSSPKPNSSRTQSLKLFGTTVLVDISNPDPIEKEEVSISNMDLDLVYYILIPNEKLNSNPNHNQIEPSYLIHQPVALRKSPTCLTTSSSSSGSSAVDINGEIDVSKEVESESGDMLLKNNIRRRNGCKWEEKGFVPYKRCSVRDAQSSDSVVEGIIGLCS